MYTSESEVGARDALLDLLGLAHEAPRGRGGNVPFSFTLGGETVRHVADGWRREVSEAEGERHRVNWSHGPTGICVTADVLRFANCPAIDYVLHITNEGDADSPVLESILPLDVVCELPGGGPVTVHYAKGSSCLEDDFLPRHRVLYHNNAFSLSPVGGRSSNGTLPFFNMTWPGGGLLAAVGWTGQWEATFGRDKEGNLLLAAGMQKTRIRLHPGETIRTPRIVLLCWEGEDRLHGHNMFRNLMIQRYLPRVNGEVALPPTTHNNASTLVKAKEPYDARVYVDGMQKSERRAFTAGLRRLHVHVGFVRGLTDQADEFIRLSDAIAGFLRDEMEGDADMQKLLRSATKNDVIKKC